MARSTLCAATSAWCGRAGTGGDRHTVDDLERVDYSPDNAGNRLISDLTALILTDLGGQAPESAGRTGLR